MIQYGSVGNSRPYNSAAFRSATCLVVALLAMVVGQYLAGYFLLWSLHLTPSHATPLTAIRYTYYYGRYPTIRHQVFLCSLVGVVPFLIVGVLTLRPRAPSLHGDASFESRRAIRKAGLLGDDGIILARLGRLFLMLAGQQGVAVAAPPRSGKDVGIAVPNELNWPGSLITSDPKKEGWRLTAGYRAYRGHDVHLFDPLSPDGRTARWNPFAYVPDSPDGRIDGIQKIASIFYAETPGTDPFWIASARSLFIGISLYLLETPSLPKTIGEVRRQGMASDDEGFASHWKRIVEVRNSGTSPLTPECKRALYDVIDLAPVTASSIRKTFTSRLDLWANPLLDRATSGNDFDLSELRRRPISVYVGANPDDLTRLRPLLSLFFEQAISLQTQELPEQNPELKYQVLMLLNEFTALGRIPIIADAVSYLPGYNVRLLLIFQALSQLREVYGHNGADTILKSLAARVLFAPKDYSEAREISDELGACTVPSRSISKPRVFQMGKGGGRAGNITISEQRRPLMLPQEVKELGKDRALILYEGLRPILARKVVYYTDPLFKSRLLPPPVQPILSSCESKERITDAAVSETEPQLSGHIAPEFQSEEFATTHEPTTADLQNLEALSLQDFAANFDVVDLPEGRSPSDAELQTAVNQFIDALRAS